MPVANTETTIELKSEETLTIKLPSGKQLRVQLSDIEEGALPELIIWFADEEGKDAEGVFQAVNCWQYNLEPAKAVDDSTPHVRLAQQLIIPGQWTE